MLKKHPILFLLAFVIVCRLGYLAGVNYVGPWLFPPQLPLSEAAERLVQDLSVVEKWEAHVSSDNINSPVILRYAADHALMISLTRGKDGQLFHSAVTRVLLRGDWVKFREDELRRIEEAGFKTAKELLKRIDDTQQQALLAFLSNNSPAPKPTTPAVDAVVAAVSDLSKQPPVQRRDSCNADITTNRVAPGVGYPQATGYQVVPTVTVVPSQPVVLRRSFFRR